DVASRLRALARRRRTRGTRRREHPCVDLDDASGGGQASSGMNPPLETRGLSKSARRGWALKDLTLTIPQGAVVGLAGPNGAGKSTLLELAVGLLAPTEGEIRVLGGDPRGDARIHARVGYVPQDGALYRSFTVAETMRFARE